MPKYSRCLTHISQRLSGDIKNVIDPPVAAVGVTRRIAVVIVPRIIRICFGIHYRLGTVPSPLVVGRAMWARLNVIRVDLWDAGLGRRYSRYWDLKAMSTSG